MKNIRELINLMENVMSIPAVGQHSVSSSIDEENESSWSIYNKKQGVEEAHIDSCRQSNPADCRTACAMEGIDDMMDTQMEPFNQPKVDEYLAFFDQLISSFVEPEKALESVMTHATEDGLGEDELACIHDAIMRTYGGEETEMDKPGDIHNTQDPFDQDDPAPMEETFDLQNGYNSEHEATADDYFPNGADSPVTNSVGPSGARMGDDPEQKKMQVSEVHKELVYGYRNYLKESSKVITKKKS